MEQFLMHGVEANAAIAEEWIFFYRLVQIARRLVAANVECTNDKWPSLGRADCLGVNRELFLFRGSIIAAEENHFGSKQPDAFSSVFECDANLFSGRNIRSEFNRYSIGRCGPRSCILCARCFSLLQGFQFSLVEAFYWLRGERNHEAAVGINYNFSAFTEDQVPISYICQRRYAQ